jgi:DNA helicase IV
VVGPVSPGPDIERAEQAYLDHAHRCLDDMRARTGHAVESLAVAARSDADAAAARAHLQARLYSLDETKAALCFGRLDEAGPRGETHYVGRRHVEDPHANPVVVDWRAPVAAPFYRATAANPYGLHLRRRFSMQGRDLVGLFDEVFDDPDHPELALGGGVPDPLLAELDRARAGEMRDIVATIQAEQDEIIRAPLERTVLVQGGPGTGKTAVGLHRAAYLLYAHREVLEGKRVLVVGPNRLFLRYIGAVLPSLGETAVTQHTVETLAGGGTRYRNRGVEGADAAELKGDARMAAVLRAVLSGMMRPLTEDVRLQTRFGPADLDAHEVNLLVKDLASVTSTHAAGREVVRRRLSALVHRQFFDPATGAGPDEEALGLRGDRAFNALLGRLWPSVSAPALVRRALGSPSALRAAAAGLLDADEQRLLLRTMARQVDAEPWTLADLPLLDEAEALVNGVPATYGHAVVDEVQELSAMALRMIARRVPKGSLTVLGDLAQATSPGSQTSWDAIAASLDADDGARAELVTGYRLPAAILDWACRLLTVAAPGLTPPQSVRTGGAPPRLVEGSDATVVDLAAAAVAEVADRWGLVGVIAPTGRLADLRAALGAGGIEVGDDGRASIDRPVTLLGAAAAKGLEFDATVVVDPVGIVAEQPGDDGRGERSLYVALTRCVHELTLVSAGPLPPPLR